MRRKERAVTEPAKIREIIRKSQVLRVGYCDRGEVYIVPVNFGCAEENEAYTFYFHGASGGRKYALSKQGCPVGFELEAVAEVVVDDTRPCSSTCRFQSVIGTGRISLITDLEEKRRLLRLILSHYTDAHLCQFDEASIRQTAVFQLRAEQMTCKERTL